MNRETSGKAGPFTVNAEAPEPLIMSRPVADHLGVDIETLANWRYRGVGPKFIKAGGLVRYRWSDVNAWIESRLCERTDDVPTEAAS